MTTKDLITEVTKSLIALLVVAGTGYAVITNSPGLPMIAGTLGVVIGFYFNRVTTPSGGSGGGA